jgi:hypothetical protein
VLAIQMIADDAGQETALSLLHLWAGGFNGTFAHLSNRAAFVVASPDPPEKQRKFAESRHWTLAMR